MTGLSRGFARSVLWASALSVIATLPGCGGGSSGSGTSPIAVAPAPSPSSTPTPTPTPAPTPSPTPAAIRVGGASPGQSLFGNVACARDTVTRDSQGHVTALPSLSGATINNSLELAYRDVDSYALDINGFGGSSFTPADKRNPPSRSLFHQFLNPTQGEFLIARDGSFENGVFTTMGLDNSQGLCFFAVGLPIDALPTDAVAIYNGWIDGVGQIAGQTARLLSSSGRVRLNTQTRLATVELFLDRLDGDPFGDQFGNIGNQFSEEITVATAVLQLLPNGLFSLSALTAGNGWTGTITGTLVSRAADNSFGGGGAGAVFTFELRNAQGNVLFGAFAAERPR